MSAPIDLPMAASDLEQSDIDAVVEVLRSGRVALGPRAEAFEHSFCDLTGMPHAIAVSSGTAALHIIVRAMGLGPGDEVLLPSFTFAASANALFFEGVTPKFVDIEPHNYTICPEDLERKVGPKTKAIMVVDVFGHPANWDALTEISERHNLPIIDDSCEALGSLYKGKPIGSFGLASTFAFYPNKQITTGEGGMITTADAALAEMARSLRNQGRGKMGAWVEHERLGYNYRLDEMSAALGLSQMKRLDEILARRARVAGRYTEQLARFPWLQCPTVQDHVEMSWFVYVIRLAAGIDRDKFMAAVESHGVPVRGYFNPLHLMPYVKERVATSELPVTETVARSTVALPFYGRMSGSQMDRVIDVLADVAREMGL